MNHKLHQPVLLAEVIELLRIKQGAWYVDATFGRGGHTEAILQQGGKVIALDVDQAAITYGQEYFAKQIQAQDLILFRENFDRLDQVTSKFKLKHQIDKISGILFDFGTSVDQLKDKQRGFSFESDSELDMRMDDRLGVKAKDLLAALSGRELSQMLWELGGEQKARAIAHAIINERAKQPITTTRQLADLVSKFYGGRKGKLHPATKVFQALRIAVNSELDSIQVALPLAFALLTKGGRIVTIAFHEGEDRLVKHYFKKLIEDNSAAEVTQKPLQPSQAELTENPRARSAKLRAIEKLT